MGEPLLEVYNIETYYGLIAGIRGVSLEVQDGAIVAMLGANGAGKTTVLKTICGAMNPEKGSVRFDGQDITGRDPDRITRLGIAHVPEGREVFPFLTTEENLKMGAFTRSRSTVKTELDRVFEHFPELKEHRRLAAGYLSGGQQQMLAIGRALMLRPKLMLLDEPSLGLSPILVRAISEIITSINQDDGVTVLLVEQNAQMALEIAHFGYILDNGRVVMEDSSTRLSQTTDVQEFYLGKKASGARGKRRWKQRKTWR